MKKIEKSISNTLEEYMSHYVSIILLEIGAVEIAKKKDSFEYTSGNHGPIYIDNRILISYKKYRKIISSALKYLIDFYLDEEPKIVFGGATAGMPFAQDLADMLNVPYFYIRKKKKEHGSKQKTSIVGDLRILQEYELRNSYPEVALVEDLVTDGGSKFYFIEEINKFKLNCKYCFVVFDREQGAAQKLMEKFGVYLYSLTTLSKTLSIGAKHHYLSNEELLSVREYLKDPKQWNLDKGFEWHE